MQLARTAPAATAPAAWAKMSLGTIHYDAQLTETVLTDAPDTDAGYDMSDEQRWRERGTSTIATAGALGAKLGYATLAKAEEAMAKLSDDELWNTLNERDAAAAPTSAAFDSKKAAAILEHDGRFYGYALHRSFTATEGFSFEPQVEDSELWNGLDYTVDFRATAKTNANLAAIVDGDYTKWEVATAK